MKPIAAVMVLACLAYAPALAVEAAKELRLVPFPKSVRLKPGTLKLRSGMKIAVGGGPACGQAALDLKQEIATAAKAACTVQSLSSDGPPILYLSKQDLGEAAIRRAMGAPPTTPQAYKLVVKRDWAAVAASADAGLVFGAQTLRQLVRANLQDSSIRCLEIDDYPALSYRGFSDDITRGRSSLLGTLQSEVRLSAFLKMNFFTYYLEHQFAFAKRRDIGPKGGSLTPGELKTLVGYARRYDVEIVGCQQSFGHFYHILKHPAYAHLREATDCLDPTNEETYELLDDMYSEQIPLLESDLFNVCCDETWELGTGPSKALVEKIGVGGVYARHMKRVHDLITGKYGKRMMMWGDIILQHPESLDQIPKDTIMLSWGYHCPESFEQDILPFAKSGFEFFVCPGVSNWNRILPDFENGVRNIQVYVRDGAKLGALGMLNTTWGDDGEPLAGCNLHGIAWGAECAWNGSTTPIEDFNRRVGAVLFGEKEDHFGQAADLLGKTPRLPGTGGMSNARFWGGDWLERPASRQSAVSDAETLLSVVDPAIEHLRIARRQARFNVEQLDCVILGAERERLIATRLLDLLSAADDYADAREALPDRSRAGRLVRRAAAKVTAIRDAHAALKPRYAELWMRENKAYALDRVLARYDSLVKQYDDKVAALEGALEKLESTGDLPDARNVGLEITELGARRTKPDSAAKEQLMPDAPWAVAECGKRFGIVVSCGGKPRLDQPIEVDLPSGIDASASALFELDAATGTQTPVAAQALDTASGKRLAFLVPGWLEPVKPRRFLCYPGSSPAPPRTGGVVLTGMKDGLWAENAKLRLLIGPEGAHIFRWEVKALDNRDITDPGGNDWHGFADVIGAHRKAPNTMEVLAAGPVLGRVRCTDTAGLVRTFSVWDGMPWVEVSFGSPTGWFINCDDIALMGADSKTPGTYLFPDGDTGPVRKPSNTTECQARRANVCWSAKYAPGGVLLALITPETPTLHHVGPGGGMGGVGIESGPPTAHFVIYGGVCPDSPKRILDGIREALDFRSPPTVGLYATQNRR